VTALTRRQRDQLESLVVIARTRLTEDLAATASGRHGIDPDGTIASEDALRLHPSELAARRELVAVLDHLLQGGASGSEAVMRMIRQAVFTQLNRLLATRIAEALGLYPQSLAAGTASHGFVDLLELVPLLADDDTQGYATYLALCADELAVDVPAMFDPRNPLLVLAPTPAALNDIVALLADPASVDLWACQDTFGWAYQFFNRKDERDAMREASSAPRTSMELAVRNQFFTPGYVADYLAQNTIGRHLVAHDPTGRLAEALPLLVDPPIYSGTPWDLCDVRALDPAVGSGHLLLSVYDILETAWQLDGVAPPDAAADILASLWGIDIDPRAAQVAAAVLTLRARRSAGHANLPAPHVVTARGLPPLTREVLARLDLTSDQIDELTALGEALTEAPKLGSLLRAEQSLLDFVHRAGLPERSGDRQPVLVTPASDDELAANEHAILDALAALADATTSTAAERLFAASTGDALRFVETLRNRYDAVLMNPPFGEPISDTKPYLRSTYPWAPSRVDLLALFVGRGLELCKPTGYLGAITNRAGLYTSTFQRWREQIVFGHSLRTLADLGYRVMSQAKVEAAAYVIGRQTPEPDARATFIRVLRDADKATALREAISHQRCGVSDSRIYEVPLATLRSLPGAPIAYSVSPTVLRLFTELPRVKESAEAVVGLQTSDDARFVRAFWEVDPRRIARTLAETERGGRWAPFAKGGDYGPYWSDIHLVVDYDNHGQRLREWGRGRVQNTEFYFRGGATWPRRTNSALSVRALPPGCIFADKGPSLFAVDPYPYLAWLNSRFSRLLIDMTAAGAEEDKTDVSRSYEVGTIRDLPDPTNFSSDLNKRLTQLADQAVSTLAELDEADETARRFVAPAALRFPAKPLVDRAAAHYRHTLAQALVVIGAHDDIDRALSAVLDPAVDAAPALRDADGPLVTDLPNRDGDPSLLTRPVRAAVDRATAEHGIARWIGLQHHTAHRTLELAAIATDTHPRQLVDALAPAALPDGEPAAIAADLLSYLVGVAFGRWDIRIGADPTTAPPRPTPMEAVPLCPPGMLVDTQGFPAVSAPPEYPLPLPPDRILLDEPGHRWDIVAGISAATAVLSNDADGLLDDIANCLGGDLRAHLRRRFFRRHRSRYSKSRRTAPIYWPLTVPSRRWSVWVYAPALRRETLFAVAGATAQRRTRAESEILRLQRERDAGGAGRSSLEVMAALTFEQELAEELRTFHAEATRIATSGWTPDLDDGVSLNAAPLADLMPDWPDLVELRGAIRAGDFSWSSAHGWKDHM
jgi:hypothetical protein